jgi:hypothetical protein
MQKGVTADNLVEKRMDLMKRPVLLILTMAALTTAVFADWKITQKMKIKGEEVGRTSTIYQKGVRLRREEIIDMGADADDPELAAMMAQMGQSMPTFPTHVSQCDLKQDLFINEKNKAFFIDYYDWSTLPPAKLERRPNQKMIIKGTVTTDTVVTDSGKRQQMFGLPARWLKVVQTIEQSADSCDGASSTRLENEGWFVTLSLESEACPIQRPPSGGGGGCRPRVIVKRMQNPGIMITGTMRTYEGNKVAAAFEIETTEFSKATLDPSMFDIPVGFAEVDSQEDLVRSRVGLDAAGNKVLYKQGGKADEKRRIAIDYFSGSASKLDQDQLRKHIADKVSAAGYNGTVIGSAADLTNGTFANVIGVEVRKIKESGASKVGGLFGKVTGSDSLSKAGKTQAEIVVTLYAADGRTVISSAPASTDVSGSSTEAVRAAIDQVIGGLIGKIK